MSSKPNSSRETCLFKIVLKKAFFSFLLDIDSCTHHHSKSYDTYNQRVLKGRHIFSRTIFTVPVPKPTGTIKKKTTLYLSFDLAQTMNHNSPLHKLTQIEWIHPLLFSCSFFSL
jgi:hypothetical protein